MNKLLRRLPRWIRRLFGFRGLGKDFTILEFADVAELFNGCLVSSTDNGDGTYTYTVEYPGVKDGDYHRPSDA